jgi:hypothetical protein
VASIVGLAFIAAFVTNPVDVGSKAATEPCHERHCGVASIDRPE